VIELHEIYDSQNVMSAEQRRVDAILEPYFDEFMEKLLLTPKPANSDRVQREAVPEGLEAELVKIQDTITRWPYGFHRTELRTALFRICDLWGLPVPTV
jgi:hypothetical protein